MAKIFINFVTLGGWTYVKIGKIGWRKMIELCFGDIICLHDGQSSHWKTLVFLDTRLYQLLSFKTICSWSLRITKKSTKHFHLGISKPKKCVVIIFIFLFLSNKSRVWAKTFVGHIGWIEKVITAICRSIHYHQSPTPPICSCFITNIKCKYDS